MPFDRTKWKVGSWYIYNSGPVLDMSQVCMLVKEVRYESLLSHIFWVTAVGVHGDLRDFTPLIADNWTLIEMPDSWTLEQQRTHLALLGYQIPEF